MPTASALSFWLPTRPFNLIAAVNRQAAATGSPGYAMGTAHADYNGHRVSVHFNDYRGYWIAEYWWAGREVLARGSFADCLRAAVAEYNRGALGCEVIAVEVPAEEVETCKSLGLVPYSEEATKAHFATYWTPLHEKITEAFWYEKTARMIPAIGMLCNSKTVEEYESKVKAALAERHAARAR